MKQQLLESQVPQLLKSYYNQSIVRFQPIRNHIPSQITETFKPYINREEDYSKTIGTVKISPRLNQTKNAKTILTNTKTMQPEIRSFLVLVQSRRTNCF